ncbi:MAG TPA: hypothetical protein VIC08_14270, partial [Cellvibrionaceae bacterium]
QRFDTAYLPAKTLTVTAPANSRESAAQPRALEGSSLPNATSTLTDDHPILRWLIISQIITVVFLLLFMVLYWRARSSHKPAAENYRETDTALWKQLKSASAENDLVHLRKLLLAWFAEHWGKPCQSLNAIAQECEVQYQDKALAADLRALDKTLFQTPTATYDGGALLQKIQALRVAHREGQKASPLPPLYPSH